MENNEMEISILPNLYLKENGTFDKEKALIMCGKIAGICYQEKGFMALENEPKEKTLRRINQTLDSGHHSVYDHITINFNMRGMSKILAMVLNNEKQYTTSEKSLRYKPITKNSIITEREYKLYNKWLNIFESKIKAKYGSIYSDKKITKLAQENARYLVTVFIPTEMIYSTSLRQINYISSFMNKYIIEADKNNIFEFKLAEDMKILNRKLEQLNVLEERLQSNEKNRRLSLFGKNLDQKDEIFGDVYQTKYIGTFSELAQSQRHKTINSQMEILHDDKQIFIPPILDNDSILVSEWIEDMYDVLEYYPQGQKVKIVESGTYDNFILKCKERLCSCAQLEINNQTRDTLIKYRNALINQNHPLKDDIEKYMHGARCTFPDYTCGSDCNFSEGKKLIRKI